MSEGDDKCEVKSGCDRSGDGDVKGSSSGNSKGVYKNHDWTLVHRWRGICQEEALLRSEKVMSDDFDIAKGLNFCDWPAPTIEKIGAFKRKSVCNLLLYF